MNIRNTTITCTFGTGLWLLPDDICSEYDIRLELCSWLIVMVLVRIIVLCCEYLVSGYSGKKRPRRFRKHLASNCKSVLPIEACETYEFERLAG